MSPRLHYDRQTQPQRVRRPTHRPACERLCEHGMSDGLLLAADWQHLEQLLTRKMRLLVLVSLAAAPHLQPTPPNVTTLHAQPTNHHPPLEGATGATCAAAGSGGFKILATNSLAFSLCSLSLREAALRFRWKPDCFDGRRGAPSRVTTFAFTGTYVSPEYKRHKSENSEMMHKGDQTHLALLWRSNPSTAPSSWLCGPSNHNATLDGIHLQVQILVPVKQAVNWPVHVYVTFRQ